MSSFTLNEALIPARVFRCIYTFPFSDFRFDVTRRIDIFCDAAVAGACENYEIFYCRLNFHILPALIFYEYSLTFLNEIRFIWRGKFSGVTVLFLLNRYTTLSNQILGIACFWRQEQGLISTTTVGRIIWFRWFSAEDFVPQLLGCLEVVC